MRPKTLVLLNPRARAGTALVRYAGLQPMLERSLDLETVQLDERRLWTSAVERAIGRGVRLFVAAGGDGTVSALAGALIERRGVVPLESLTLGSIGLGSSNDFHELATARAAIPLRLATRSARLVRPMRVRLLDDRGNVDRRVSMVSASIGVVARGNVRFNRGGIVLDALKRRSVAVAVTYAALSAIARHRDVQCVLQLDGATLSGGFANVSIGRTRQLAGPFAYDALVDSPPGDDRLGVHVCPSLGRLGLVRTLLGLARRERPARWARERVFHRWTGSVRIDAATPFDVEIDGETTRATQAQFDLEEERLNLCAA